MAVDNCTECKADYDITPANTQVFIYLGYPPANNLEIKCPEGHECRIFIQASALADLLKPGGWTLSVFLQPSPEIKEAADRMWKIDADVPEPPAPHEIEVPPWMLRELNDDLREFGGQR